MKKHQLRTRVIKTFLFPILCFSFLAVGAQPLFVEFAYFNGRIANSNVVLDWVTLSETHNDFFQIEHSKNGREFTILDKVDSAKDSTEINTYQYTHRNALAGNNYYRLSQVDIGGRSTSTDMVIVYVETSNDVTIFPTTVNNIVNLKIMHQVSKPVPVHIFNSTGNLIYTDVIPVGNSHLYIPTNNLHAGYYFVKLKIDGVGVVTKSFVKKTL